MLLLFHIFFLLLIVLFLVFAFSFAFLIFFAVWTCLVFAFAFLFDCFLLFGFAVFFALAFCSRCFVRYFNFHFHYFQDSQGVSLGPANITLPQGRRAKVYRLSTLNPTKTN